MVVVLWHAWLELMRRPFFRANTFALNPVLHEIYGGSTVATIEHASDLLATELLQGKHLDVVRNEAICPQTGHEKKTLHIAQQSRSVAPRIYLKKTNIVVSIFCLFVLVPNTDCIILWIILYCIFRKYTDFIMHCIISDDIVKYYYVQTRILYYY